MNPARLLERSLFIVGVVGGVGELNCLLMEPMPKVFEDALISNCKFNFGFRNV